MDTDQNYQECSGQFRLRIPKALHAALAREARAQGVSMNSYVLFLLSTRHSQEMSWQEAADFYVHRLQDTVKEVHDMVFSMTIGEPEPPGIYWRSSGSSSMVTQ